MVMRAALAVGRVAVLWAMLGEAEVALPLREAKPVAMVIAEAMVETAAEAAQEGKAKSFQRKLRRNQQKESYDQKFQFRLQK